MSVLRECLNVRKGDRVLVVTDEVSKAYGEVFYNEAREITDAYMILLEEFGERPISEYPTHLREYVDMIKPTVSIYAASIMPGELPLRKGYIEHVISLNAKHAHIPGVDDNAMEAMRGCKEIARITEKLKEIVDEAHVIRAEGEGTEIEVEVGSYRWVADTGILDYGEWGNLPAGEVFTTPLRVNGVLRVTALGDYFKKYGRIDMVVEIKDSEIKGCEGKLCEEFMRYIESCNRIGEFAIGTNTNIKHVTGNLLVDEKIPGVHLAVGDPLGELTGAEWECDIHVDMVSPFVDVYVDDRLIMKEGKPLWV